ncbi:hypothetical protein MRX96_024204 [Rhipicephalus microplus]
MRGIPREPPLPADTTPQHRRICSQVVSNCSLSTVRHVHSSRSRANVFAPRRSFLGRRLQRRISDWRQDAHASDDNGGERPLCKARDSPGPVSQPPTAAAPHKRARFSLKTEKRRHQR